MGVVANKLSQNVVSLLHSIIAGICPSVNTARYAVKISQYGGWGQSILI